MEKTDTIYKAWGIEEGVHEACGLKPMLSAKGLIESLKAKGVTFDRCSEEDAIRSLLERDTYLHLASYRKLFQKHLEGERKGQYVRLDFADLLDLDSLDGLIRRVFLVAANDIERITKTKLVSRCEEDAAEDGYSIVSDFMNSQKPTYRNSITQNLKTRARSSSNTDTYTGMLIEHYESAMPIWVFLEVVPFGTMLAFLLFCAHRWSDKDLEDRHYELTSVKSVRNCSSHQSCLVNGFVDKNVAYYPARYSVMEWLSRLNVCTAKIRKAKMRNRSMQELITTLKVFDTIQGQKTKSAFEALKTLSAELNCYVMRYGKENAFVSYLSFLAKTIDSTTAF